MVFIEWEYLLLNLYLILHQNNEDQNHNKRKITFLKFNVQAYKFFNYLYRLPLSAES